MPLPSSLPGYIPLFFKCTITARSARHEEQQTHPFDTRLPEDNDVKRPPVWHIYTTFFKQQTARLSLFLRLPPLSTQPEPINHKKSHLLILGYMIIV